MNKLLMKFLYDLQIKILYNKNNNNNNNNTAE